MNIKFSKNFCNIGLFVSILLNGCTSDSKFGIKNLNMKLH